METINKERVFNKAEKKALKAKPAGLSKIWHSIKSTVKNNFMNDKPVHPDLEEELTNEMHPKIKKEKSKEIDI